MDKKLKRKPWYPMAMAICIGILFFFLISNIGTIWDIICSIAYYLYPVIAGIIIAYLINPLMKLFEEKVFFVFKNKGVKRAISLVLSLTIVIVLIVLVFVILVPQLYDSIMTIYHNKDEYLGVLTLGGHLGAWGIGLIFSVYFLAAKDRIKEVSKNLLRGIQKNEELTNTTLKHLTRMDFIVSRYVAMSIVDSIILGVANAIFMVIIGMEYTGLVSVVIGVTNLIPTFGPIIGIVVGGIILVLSNPWHALYFVIFMTAAMMIDGYLIRPKLFGKTLGVSGIWILIAVIVGGRILGVLGILLSIPVVAIIDYLIKEVFIPSRRAKEQERIEKEKKAKEKKEKDKKKKLEEKKLQEESEEKSEEKSEDSDVKKEE